MLYTVEWLLQHWRSAAALINGRYVPVRPIGGGLRYRVRAAWLVLTGKADAFIWPEGQ